MNKYPLIFTFALLSMVLVRCAEEPVLPAEQDNPDLLFPTAQPLSIRQLPDAGEISFVLEDAAPSYVHVGIYATAPVLVEGEVVSTPEPLWQYLGATTGVGVISLAEGELRADVPELDEDFFLCAPQAFFWAAWGWEETAQVVTHSTGVNNLITSLRSPVLELEGAGKIGNGPNDTLIRAGVPFDLRLAIANRGDLRADSVVYTLRQPVVAGLPAEGLVSDIAPGNTTSVVVPITLPMTANFGDVFEFDLDLVSNGCVRATKRFSLTVNDVRVALVDIQLKRINYLPTGIFWDFGLPVQFDPDIYYILFSPEGDALDTSAVIDNATGDWPNTPCLGDWADINPVVSLTIDSTYSVVFWDEDIADDDRIGSVVLRPIDYIDTRPSIIRDTTDEVTMEWHLIWE